MVMVTVMVNGRRRGNEGKREEERSPMSRPDVTKMTPGKRLRLSTS